MRGSGLLLLWLLLLAADPPGCGACAVGAPQAPESFVQRVYQPFLTTCAGHRVCSTYRTIYRTAYRRLPAPSRPGRFPGACGPVCWPQCQNGGTCVWPGRCLCPMGWQGAFCQTGTRRGDVEEEVRALRARVAVLEQKLQSVLAPLLDAPNPGHLLAHSLQQLERIDSLSDQVAFLEEQLGACSCRKDA